MMNERELFADIVASNPILRESIGRFGTVDPLGIMPKPLPPEEWAQLVATCCHPEYRAALIDALEPDLVGLVRRHVAEALADHEQGAL